MMFDEALSMIEKGSGRHFDPDAVAAFGKIAPALHVTVLHADHATLRH